MKPILLPLVVLLLAACEREERPPAPTAQEAEQLDNAEAMLNEAASDDR